MELLDQALITENIYDDGDSFWFTGFDYNALFKMDKNSLKAELTGTFPNERFVWQRQYISTVRYNKKLYFVPFTANEVAEYDMEHEIFGKISVDAFDEGMYRTGGCDKFFGALVLNDKIYFIPFYYPGILCYEPKSGILTCFTDWIEEIEKIRASEWGYFIGYEQAGNQLILPCACADAVVIFDTVTQTSKIIRTEDTRYACKFCGICHIEDYFYLVSADGTVSKRRLKAEDEETTVVRMPQSDAESNFDKIEFYPIRNNGNTVYFFPYQKNDGYKLNINTNEITRMEPFCDEKNFTGGNFSFLTAMFSGGKLYMFTGNSRRLIELEQERKEERKLFLSEPDRSILMNYKKSEFMRRICEAPMVETVFDSLTFMLNVLHTEDKVEDATEKSGRYENGNRIYGRMIALL